MNNFTKKELEEKVNMLYKKEVSRVFIESRLLEEIEHLKKAQHDLKQLIQIADKKIETIWEIKDSNAKLIRECMTECAAQIASNDIINALIERLKNENK